MLDLIAKTEPERSLLEGYLSLALILLIGLTLVICLVVLAASRRWRRRQAKAIEQSKADRRQAGATEKVDAWSASASRYVDEDKLPEDVPYDSEQDPPADDDSDAPFGPDDPPPHETEEPENDPYGLFDDKPYRDPEDDDEDDDEDEDWDAEEEDKP